MKIGDRLAVQIDGMDVAEAVIEDIEDGHATLVIPPTRLVVQVKQSLDLAATREPEVDRVLGGMENDTPPVSEASQAITPPTPGYNQPGSDVGEGIHNIQLDSSAID